MFAQSDIDLDDIIDEFLDEKKTSIEKDVTYTVDATTDYWSLSSRCIGEDEICNRDALVRSTGCDIVSSELCLAKKHTLSLRERRNVDDLLTGRQYITLLTYSDAPANNPEVSDNKIQVLSEKVSYKI